jgi:hypothetical protein
MGVRVGSTGAHDARNQRCRYDSVSKYALLL